MPPSFDMRSSKALSMSVLITAMLLLSKLVTLPHPGIRGKVGSPCFPSGPHRSMASPDPAGHHQQYSHADSFGGRDSSLHLSTARLRRDQFSDDRSYACPALSFRIRLTNHICGFLVLPKPNKTTVTKVIVRSPFEKLKLPDQQRREPNTLGHF